MFVGAFKDVLGLVMTEFSKFIVRNLA